MKASEKKLKISISHHAPTWKNVACVLAIGRENEETRGPTSGSRGERWPFSMASPASICCRCNCKLPIKIPRTRKLKASYELRRAPAFSSQSPGARSLRLRSSCAEKRVWDANESAKHRGLYTRARPPAARGTRQGDGTGKAAGVTETDVPSDTILYLYSGGINSNQCLASAKHVRMRAH